MLVPALPQADTAHATPTATATHHHDHDEAPGLPQQPRAYITITITITHHRITAPPPAPARRTFTTMPLRADLPIVRVEHSSMHTIETRNPENLFGLWSGE